MLVERAQVLGKDLQALAQQPGHLAGRRHGTARHCAQLIDLALEQRKALGGLGMRSDERLDGAVPFPEIGFGIARREIPPAIEVEL